MDFTGAFQGHKNAPIRRLGEPVRTQQGTQQPVNQEDSFPAVLLAGFVAILTVGPYYRIRSQATIVPSASCRKSMPLSPSLMAIDKAIILGRVTIRQERRSRE